MRGSTLGMVSSFHLSTDTSFSCRLPGVLRSVGVNPPAVLLTMTYNSEKTMVPGLLPKQMIPELVKHYLDLQMVFGIFE